MMYLKVLLYLIVGITSLLQCRHANPTYNPKYFKMLTCSHDNDGAVIKGEITDNNRTHQNYFVAFPDKNIQLVCNDNNIGFIGRNPALSSGHILTQQFRNKPTSDRYITEISGQVLEDDLVSYEINVQDQFFTDIGIPSAILKVRTFNLSADSYKSRLKTFDRYTDQHEKYLLLSYKKKQEIEIRDIKSIYGSGSFVLRDGALLVPETSLFDICRLLKIQNFVQSDLCRQQNL